MRGKINDMHFGASQLLFKRAEELRKFCTYEEKIMWSYLSGKQTRYKCRRQHALLFYIADFYCHQLKLVIEINGSIHNKEDVKINDALRQKILKILEL